MIESGVTFTHEIAQQRMPQGCAQSVNVSREQFHISGTTLRDQPRSVRIAFIVSSMPDSLEDRILERVRHLRPGTTMCPGRLSKNLGFKLADLRATYLALAAAGRQHDGHRKR